MESAIFGALIGSLAGLLAGLFGASAFDGLMAGAVVGAVVSGLFSLAPRSLDEPRIAIESFSPAGAAGALVAGLYAGSGVLGTVISIAVGWVLGLAIPAIVIASIMGGRGR